MPPFAGGVPLALLRYSGVASWPTELTESPAQGLTFLTAFYWDRDDASRAWSKRFFEQHKRMPTSAQAAVYSAIRHYLRAVEAAALTSLGP